MVCSVVPVTAATLVLASQAIAQGGGESAAPGSVRRTGLWDLFVQSFDLFSVLLIAGSLIAVALIVRGALDIRRRVILPPRSIARMRELADAGRFGEMVEAARKDRSIVGRVVYAAASSEDTSPQGMREMA